MKPLLMRKIYYTLDNKTYTLTTIGKREDKLCRPISMNRTQKWKRWRRDSQNKECRKPTKLKGKDFTRKR